MITEAFRPLSSPLLALLFFLGGAIGGLARDAGRIDPGSVEVTISPDKPRIMLGEPVFLSYVVTNKSPVDLQVLVGGDYRNRLGRPDTFKVETISDDGHPVTQPSAGENGGGMTGPKRIPASGSYTFRLFLPHWATIDRTGGYTITARRVLKLSAASSLALEKTTDVPSEARTRIEIVPLDAAALGVIIDALGVQMLAQKHRWESQEPSIALKSIHDERVIPHFIKGLHTDDYSLKFVALDALTYFDNAAAFAALQEGMKTTGRDISHTANEDLANGSADNIRHAAGVALSNSSHPAALEFLLEQRKDSYSGVRLDVVHALGNKIPPEKAIPLLEEMAHDSDKMVSDEAKRYLRRFRGEK